MAKQWLVRFLSVVAAFVVLGGTAVAQKDQKKEEDVTGVLAEARADWRADKVEIVRKTMNLSPADSDKFWPVYRDYENEVAKLNDQRIDMLKQYSRDLSSMTDKEAKKLAEDFFSWENQRTDLRRDYFDRFKKATSAVTAAKFFQIEHRLDLVVDAQIASQVPGLYEKSPASAEK